MHTITFSHRFLLFGSKLEFPWDCGTIQSHAKTLLCARSLRVRDAGILHKTNIVGRSVELSEICRLSYNCYSVTTVFAIVV